MTFEWDPDKNEKNQKKHGVSFEFAQRAFLDPSRVISENPKHSNKDEKRYFCFGKISGDVVTVRFTLRGNKIRVIGAGLWREGRKIYESQK